MDEYKNEGPQTKITPLIRLHAKNALQMPLENGRKNWPEAAAYFCCYFHNRWPTTDFIGLFRRVDPYE